MNDLELTPEMFIAQFPEFAPKPSANNDGNCCYCPQEPINPNIDIMISRALNYFAPFSALCGDRKQYAVFLLTAHFLTLQNNISLGETNGGIETNASVDKVSVTIAPPPFTEGFEYFLGQTIYGQQLLAFLNIIPVTPSFIGGSFQRVLN